MAPRGSDRARPAPGRHLPLLCAHHHPVASAQRGAPSPSRLCPRGNLRDAAPAVEHRGHVGSPVSPDGRAHRVHHGCQAGRARRGHRTSRPRRGTGGVRMLERYFDLRARGASLGGEVRGGLTTFMVMAYIIFVNPAILSFAGVPALKGQGPPFAAVQAATCLVAGLLTIAMGVVANYPLAIASGMGLNAVVAFQLIAGLKLPWPAAMGVVFLEGVAITVLVLTGVREAVLNAIPLALKRAISVGIGLF